MSKLSDIFDQIEDDVDMADHRRFKSGNYEQQIINLFLDLTKPEYEAAYNRGDMETYEMLVKIRERARGL